MLIHSLIPGTVEGAISFVSDIATLDFSGDWLLGAGTWQGSAQLDQQPHRIYMNFTSRKEISSDASNFLNHSSSGVRLSTSTMSGNSVPLHVYKRRKRQRNSPAICPNHGAANTNFCDGCNSSNSSDAHSRATKELVISVEAETEDIGSPFKRPVKCTADGFVSNCGSSDEYVHREDPCLEEGLRNDKTTVLDGCGVDDSCSSSKLNLDVTVSFKTDVEDTAHCSSSGVSLLEQSWDSMSGKDFCIAILRSRGLLEEATPFYHLSSADDSTANFCVQKCKVCASSETSRNMLICDSCEDAFHAKCCNPRIKRIPTNEWFCYSCLKKKHKMLKEKSTDTSLNINHDSSGCRSETSSDELGPIYSMLKNIEPSKFKVRIGDKFQAEIPDWASSTTDEDDPRGEPEELDWSEYLNLNSQNSIRTNWLSSIGNWVQCQEFIEGIDEHADGTICGKWRRAPLFEVQTDDWECFRAVLWDPAHADCAVPQELPTEEVLRQLKYIEMLKPRPWAKRQNLDQTKTGVSQVRKQV